MKIGSLVSHYDGSIGIIKEIETDDENGEYMYKILFNDGEEDWLYHGVVDEVIMIGSLVRSYNGYKGIVQDIDTSSERYTFLYKVAFDDGEVSWIPQKELEVINEEF